MTASYKNFRGELISDCENVAGTCNDFNHYTKAQVENLISDVKFMKVVKQAEAGQAAKKATPVKNKKVAALLEEKEGYCTRLENTYSLMYMYQQDVYNAEVNKNKIAGLRRRATNLKEKIADLNAKIVLEEKTPVSLSVKKRKVLAYIKKHHGVDLKEESQYWRTYDIQYLNRTTGYVIVTQYATDQSWSQGYMKTEINSWKIPQKHLL